MLRRFKRLVVDRLKANARDSFSRGELARAEIACKNALGLEKDEWDCTVLLAHIYANSSNPFLAFDLFRRALELSPPASQVRLSFGMLLIDLLEFDEAYEHLDRVVQSEPENVPALVALGQCYHRMGRHDEAIGAIKKSINICESSYMGYVLLGEILVDLGQHADAIANFERAIELHGARPEGYLAISRMKQSGGLKDDAIKTYVEKIDGIINSGLCVDAKHESLLNFARANFCDAVGNYDTAYEHYARANSLAENFDHPKFSIHAYREGNAARLRAFTPALYARFRPPGEESSGSQLIFIVGMPRTGTTLVEQILASHPSIVAGGERPDVARLIHDMQSVGRFRGVYPYNVNQLQQWHVDELRRIHLARVARVARPGHYFTDKLPENYREIGLLRLLFPAARFVHCVRDPLDTCLSIFFQDFERLPYSTSLESIVEVFDCYKTTMDSWIDISGGSIFALQYEELVDDPESIVRGMLNHCGLQWDPSCLAFHRSSRVPSTASRWQVKRALYKTSKRRWLNYKNRLGQLATAMLEKGHLSAGDYGMIVGTAEMTRD